VNGESESAKGRLKRWILPRGRAPRAIHGGVLDGLTMDLDLEHQSQRWLGLQERELYGWLRRLSADVQTAVDVGANDGMYTLYFLARTPAAKVVAVEPDAGSRDLLHRNLALNGFADDSRLQVVQKFVGDSCDRECVTLDSLLPSLRLPCLVKVDIDGGELGLLRGAKDLLGAGDVRWIIEVHSSKLESDCLQIVQEAGYRTTVVPNAWWRILLPELRPGELNRWFVAVRSTQVE